MIMEADRSTRARWRRKCGFTLDAVGSFRMGFSAARRRSARTGCRAQFYQRMIVKCRFTSPEQSRTAGCWSSMGGRRSPGGAGVADQWLEAG